jgi:hypothetical protein
MNAETFARLNDRQLDSVVERVDSGQPLPIFATPYVWKNPATIRRRQWLYGYLLIRKFVTATVAPGGVGKSALIIAETLAQVSGLDLLGVIPPKSPLRVWLWNLEDPQEETERRIQAAALHYGLGQDDIGDRLFVDSGRDQTLVIAIPHPRSGRAIIVAPVVESIIAEIIARKVDVIVIDPFVSSHRVAENDNGAMDTVIKEWGRVAERGNCAVHLVHHTRKSNGTETTAQDARGGSAAVDGTRVTRVLNRMTKEESTQAGVDNHRLYFRTLHDKANLQPPADVSDWFKLVSVDLANGPDGSPGDSVGVVTAWQWPDALAGITGADFDKVAAVIRSDRWRESPQAGKWVGKAVGIALDLDISTKHDKAKVIGLLKLWKAAGSIVVVEGYDEKKNMRPFVEVREEA